MKNQGYIPHISPESSQKDFVFIRLTYFGDTTQKLGVSPVQKGTATPDFNIGEHHLE